MVETGVIVLAHGSRGERGKGEVEAILSKMATALRPFLRPGIQIVGAAMQFNQPDLQEATALLTRRGIRKIVIAPYFLFAGRHITEDIPQIIEGLRGNYPDTEFIMAENLGQHESFVDMIAERIVRAAPDLAHDGVPVPPRLIESSSLDIVGSLIDSDLTGGELAVVKRIVHACGDPSVARLVKFSPGAINDGTKAIVAGRPIFTDVHMTLAGIDRRLAAKYGCTVGCALDSNIPSGDANTTRTASAVRQLGSRLNGAIVAIGNAPTALFALIELIDKKQASPALVVGMPVGFVQARESKQALTKRDVPYITVTGTRGGSAMAAAAVNALLRLAETSPVIKSRKKGADVESK